MKRDYQYDFSKITQNRASLLDRASREKKAKTMVAVLKDYFQQQSLSSLKVLDVGSSAGIIDAYLADYFGQVIGIDIDQAGIEQAQLNFQKPNLKFQLGDALNLDFADEQFDVVICSHVYEHVPSAEKMMAEIYRVLKPKGVCYFSGSNRFMWNEPHYQLPLLSAIPRPLAHLYIRLARGLPYYHELHYSYWGLKRLVSAFIVHDYTRALVQQPLKYHTDYMIPTHGLKARLIRFMVDHVYWLFPGYIWLLQKPSADHH